MYLLKINTKSVLIYNKYCLVWSKSIYGVFCGVEKKIVAYGIHEMAYEN